MRGIRGIAAATLVSTLLAVGAMDAEAAPEGQVTWGIHVRGHS